MSRPLKWLVTVVVIAGAAALLIWLFLQQRGEMAKEQESERPIKVPPRVARVGGETVVTLDRDTQARIGLQTETLAAATLPPELAAYGTLIEDPSRSFVLRAPVAGTLRPAGGRGWPALGEDIDGGAIVAALEPRFTPVEQVDLSSRLAAARADVAAATASVSAARASYDRTKILNAENKNASDRALQEADARLRGEEARLAAARQTVQLIQSSLSSPSGSAGARPLRVERAGQVVEILAQPGEAVESGQPILRLAGFDRLLARVDVPAGSAVPGPVSGARIVPFGREDRPLDGERVALAAAVDPKFQGQSFLFAVSASGLSLRPGAAVTAYLRLPGEPQHGVFLPPSSVVHYAGKAWAYVQTAADKFSRREADADRPTARGLFTITGWKAGDRVVTAGAQVLLSEELKSQIQLGEEGEPE
ncbi:MAG TPA: efflux RND transporter periplasmic adaptor subunit [Bryobacterales bacterium]|nr:efflux RND transporter periplasmic adaptor subunit [Bryobacterales bacterium]